MPEEINSEVFIHKESTENPVIKMAGSSIAHANHPEENQDTGFMLSDTKSPLKFFAVLDGMGGPKGGFKASRLARDTMVDRITKGNIDPNISQEQSVELVKALLVEADRAVNTLRTGKFSKMGTTATVGLIFENPLTKTKQLIIGNVGDSRIYLFRNGKTTQLTKDDNLAEIGRPNILTQSIGEGDAKSTVTIDELQDGDKLIAVCDGIPEALKEDTDIIFYQALVNNSPEKAAQFITRKAREFSNQGRKMDDQTAIVVEIGRQEKASSFHQEIHDPLSAPEQHHEPYRLKPGTMVNVLRSDGTIEDDWFVMGEQNGKIRVGNSNGATKLVDQSALDTLNPTLEHTKTWDELLFAINQLDDTISGTSDNFSNEEIYNLVQKAREQKISILSITRSYGIRSKVEELLKLDSIKKQLG